MRLRKKKTCNLIFDFRYEVITTPTDIIMVIEYAGRELFNYIVEKGRVKLIIK
jgi:hypothetical protein